MSIADIFTVVIALLALLVNVVFVTFQITWSITQDRAKDQKDKILLAGVEIYSFTS